MKRLSRSYLEVFQRELGDCPKVMRRQSRGFGEVVQRGWGDCSEVMRRLSRGFGEAVRGMGCPSVYGKLFGGHGKGRLRILKVFCILPDLML